MFLGAIARLHAFLAWTVIVPLVTPVAVAGVEVSPDLVYGKGYVAKQIGAAPELHDLKFDLWRSDGKAASPQPAVVMLHGGSFMGGSKSDRKLTKIAEFLAEHGYVCFVADYRLIGDNPSAPPEQGATLIQAAVHAAFVDAKTIVRHVRANAENYGIDANRIAILGESAGAFAALAAGVSDPGDYSSDGPGLPVPAENNPGENPKPNAVVDLWGSAEAVADKFDSQDPPILIAHGTQDTHLSVPFSLSGKIRARCEANAIPYRFYPLEGEAHGAWDGEFEGKNLTTLILEFLDAYLKP